MTIGVSIFNVLIEHFNLNLNDARFFAGHSLGEYTALVCAGSLSIEKAAYFITRKRKGNAGSGTRRSWCYDGCAWYDD